MLVDFYGLTFDLPAGWLDITEDLGNGAPPTLAKPQGVGVIQFSIARYRSGDDPKITISDLRGFLDHLCQHNGLTCGHIIEREREIVSVTAECARGEMLTLAGYFTNGSDLVFATYECLEADRPLIGDELTGARQVFDTLQIQ
jgi:hypothetical protein